MTLPCLDIHSLSVNYGKMQVLDRLDLPCLKPGTVTALIGPNAAGKSTLMKAVAGLIKAQGTVRLGDKSISGLPLGERADIIRFVPQVFHTQARLTVFDLLLVGRMTRRMGRPDKHDLDAVVTALERVGIVHLCDRLASDLSGGQQQLVALAQALTRPSPVLLLDEPTSALDLRNQLEAISIMRKVAEDDGRIVVTALHDLNLVARHANRVVLLGNGRIIADGTPDEVLCSGACGETYGVCLSTCRSQRGSLVVEAYLDHAHTL